MSHPDLSASSDPPTESELLTTGDMARLSSNTLRTVRFYEEAEVLRPARRTEGGHRLFPRSELDRLRLVTELRQAGLSLEEIKAVLAVKEGANSAKDAGERAQRLLAQHLAALQAKLELLRKLEADLRSTHELLEACVRCDDESFPAACRACHHMSPNADKPLGLRVVWGVGTDSRPEPDAAP
jgi:DNA-binding transcriptional MerR regulator